MIGTTNAGGHLLDCDEDKISDNITTSLGYSVTGAITALSLSVIFVQLAGLIIAKRLGWLNIHTFLYLTLIASYLSECISKKRTAVLWNGVSPPSADGTGDSVCTLSVIRQLTCAYQWYLPTRCSTKHRYHNVHAGQFRRLLRLWCHVGWTGPSTFSLTLYFGHVTLNPCADSVAESEYIQHGLVEGDSHRVFTSYRKVLRRVDRRLVFR